MINLERRKALKKGGGLGLLGLFAVAGLIQPGVAAENVKKSAFESKSMSEAIEALGFGALEKSNAIQLTVPEIAENGAVVPVTVVSSLAKTEQIHILIEKNPSVLAASFNFSEGREGMVTTRVKMIGTSQVIALVKADGKFYIVSKEVKVTAGGCGG